jgi:hypothetical protein
MLRAHCPGEKNSDSGEFEECGCSTRVTAKWANQYGAVCPHHGSFAVELPLAGDSEELEATPDTEASAWSCVPLPCHLYIMIAGLQNIAVTVKEVPSPLRNGAIAY